MRSPARVLNSLTKHSQTTEYRFERLYRILFRNYTLFTPMIIMKNKKPTTGYCSQYLCCIKAQTFQDIVKELNELAEKHSTDDFDEVVITVSLGRNCTSPIRCQPCIFHKPSSKRSQMQDNSKK